jgi:quinol monooxygenase YgiN
MIIVAVEMMLEEDVINGFRDDFRILIEETRKESGCLKYVASVDVNNPRIIYFNEMWESMDALKLHSKSSHMAAFQKAVNGLRRKSYNMKMYGIDKELHFPKSK